MVANVLRDAETNPTLREISDLRFGAAFGAILESVSGSGAEEQPALALALSFYTWRTLVRTSGPSSDAAARLMVRTVLASN